MNKEKKYAVPQLWICEVEVERGFAESVVYGAKSVAPNHSVQDDADGWDF